MSKYSKELIIKACKDFVTGALSFDEICSKYRINRNSLQDWVAQFISCGETSFIKTPGNATYTSDFKIQAVEEYISGAGSIRNICYKYQIPSTYTLRKWISLYNANRELKDYCPKREVYMADARRKTTIDERRQIVEYCLSHNRDYKGTASLYDISYSQIYSWVKKYDSFEDEGLIDKRGHHKTDDHVDELERLRRENKRLKRQLEENDMLMQLLKKVKEFERM